MTAFAQARRLLDVALAGLEAAGRPTPSRAFVAPGAVPAADCEQITVCITRPSTPGTPGAETLVARSIPRPRFVEMRLDLFRCFQVTDDPTPDPDKLETVTVGLLADCDALLAALTPARLANEDGLPAYVGPITSQGPEGAIVGVFCVVHVPQ